jgi:hypothetical protein
VYVVVLITGLLICTTAVIGSTGGAIETTVIAQEKPSRTPAFAGVSECVNCHTKGPPGEAPELCRCTEVPIWEKYDKHKQAYDALDSDRSKRMGALLKWDVKQDKRCINCHGVHIEDSNLLKESKALGFKLSDGVSCVVCHGAYAEWVEKHGGPRRAAWRKLSRQEKDEKYGMTDLWDPSKRARMCDSCHIGNTDQEKVVTHEMYAAGHPPLPSIELATFSEEMPRHWQYLREKKPEVQKMLNFEETQARWEQSKLVLVSSAVALRESLNLIATQAAQALKDAPASSTLDYALFDCAACHHELQYPGWRQERGYVGKPGRPQMQEWPTVLTKVGLSQVRKEEAELNGGLQKLTEAFSARPFGDPKRVATDAAQLVSWMDSVIECLNKSELDQASVTRLRQALTAFKKDAYPDYESARQRAWAFVILSDELACKEGLSADDQKKAYRKRLNDVDAALEGRLMLMLPSGQNKQILADLPTSLKKMGKYDPRQFIHAFRDLAKEGTR